LPDASSLFRTRSQRFEALAPGHELEPYLRFLAAVTRAQHATIAQLPQPALPPADHIRQALAHGMPPLLRSLYDPDPAAMATMDRLLAELAGLGPPAETTAAIAGLRTASDEERRGRIVEALKDTDPGADLAQRVLIIAGLQVHFARLAGRLSA